MCEAAAHAGRSDGGPWQAVPDEAAASAEFAALPATPYWARRHAQAVFGAWQVPSDIIEVAVLLVSELITNAIVATARPACDPLTGNTGRIVQTLRRQPGRIVIEVSDPDPSPPILADAGPDAETGRGLLVQALSKEWSYYFPPSGGKIVYCMLGTE